MPTTDRYSIRDLGLAAEGHQKIEWAQRHMPVLNEIRREFEKTKPFQGLKVAVSVHLEAKTAYLGMVLAAAGADVAVTGSNPLSTQDAVCAALADAGLKVYAWHGATTSEYFNHLRQTLSFGPDLIIDDGGDLVHLLHTELAHLKPGVRGGSEETTTGVIRLKARAAAGQLDFPMIAVNDAYCKYLFDNRYGTGQSTWDGIMRTTNLMISGKKVVVAGYGWCGKGVAMRAKGLGADVIVCEVDPIKAIEAVMDGFRVMPMEEAAREGDIYVTVTGCRDVIGKKHFAVMKDGAILTNAGHFDVEVNVKELGEMAVAKQRVRANIDEYRLADGRRLYVLGEGRLVNLACADGHPAEIMDLSFALQALALEYVNKNYQNLRPDVYKLPVEVDKRVASLKIASMGIRIDSLTPEQEEYLHSWQV